MTAQPPAAPARVGAEPRRSTRPRRRGRVTGGRRALLLGGLVVGLAAVAVLSLGVGTRAVSPEQLLAVLSGSPVDDEVRHVVVEMRGARATLAVLVGAALGVAGALIQALTRNPLADPGILGVNAGAALAVTIGVGTLGIGVGTGATVWFAFAGAAAATLMVTLLGSAGRAAATPLRLTLVGVALAAVLLGITTAITLLDPATFDSMRGWRSGSVADRGWPVVAAIIPAVAAGLLVAGLAARPLNALALGDDVAVSLGVGVVGGRIAVIAALTLLAGAATAAAGPIAFVGLMVPHAARWIVGQDQRWVLAYSAVLGAALMLLADMLGRVALGVQEVPAGVITAVLGAPVLILLARRPRMAGL
ncbi:FecCD family ABC transporter permease [Mycetocola reblochoni]|uniref:ABC-type Fe3+-siderophore transport system, permease component n=2 Tax=Mycetocola reblochoni TaxID=331618 RepID=A0A1R4JTB0_9MICO|nr:iron ABC transporter permease [Mycetocola reblochoni]RLP70404.1 iron ABC transporter permease [Mycetocola reblochoni]SJN35238.1 ABC-type Fe3+-siderophore transport system, permease component [Mycetocola reblochoni REB411]